MKLRTLVATLFGTGLAIAGALPLTVQAADTYASPQDAQAMLKRAVAHFGKVGKDKALKDFTEDKATWTDRDLYITGMSMEGVTVAHGVNARQVGRNMLDFKDPDGKELFRERIAMAAKQNAFSQDYKFSDPVTKTVQPKTMFCEKVQDIILCSGAYKRK